MGYGESVTEGRCGGNEINKLPSRYRLALT